MPTGHRALDYKERWQEFYEEAIEDGASESDAGKIADERLADFFGTVIDQARDREKYKNM